MRNNENLYSIVIPIYNAEKYLEECLESIVQQTYVNWELILVNDGSVDQSNAICERFKKRFPDSIKYIEQENKGLLQARRVGLNQVSGDYIMACDADDKLALFALEKIEDLLQKSQADFLFFNFSVEENMANAALGDYFVNGQIFEADEKKKLYEVICCKVDFNPIWNKVVKKERIDFETDYSIYNREVQMGEDLFQVLPLLTKAKKAVFLDENLYYYRITRNSMTKNRVDFNDYLSVKRVLERLDTYIDLWGLENPEFYKTQKAVFYIKERLGAISRGDFKNDKQELAAFLTSLSEDDLFQKVMKNRRLVKLSATDKFIFRMIEQKKIKFLLKCYALNQKLVMR